MMSRKKTPISRSLFPLFFRRLRGPDRDARRRSLRESTPRIGRIGSDVIRLQRTEGRGASVAHARAVASNQSHGHRRSTDRSRDEPAARGIQDAHPAPGGRLSRARRGGGPARRTRDRRGRQVRGRSRGASHLPYRTHASMSPNPDIQKTNAPRDARARSHRLTPTRPVYPLNPTSRAARARRMLPLTTPRRAPSASPWRPPSPPTRHPRPKSQTAVTHPPPWISTPSTRNSSP